MIYKIKIMVIAMSTFLMVGCSNISGIDLKLGMLAPGAELVIDFSNAHHSMCIDIDQESQELLAGVVSGLVTGAELANRTARLKYLTLVNAGGVNAEGKHVVCVDIAAVDVNTLPQVAQLLVAGVMSNAVVADKVVRLVIVDGDTHVGYVTDGTELAEVFAETNRKIEIKNFD